MQIYNIFKQLIYTHIHEYPIFYPRGYIVRERKNHLVLRVQNHLIVKLLTMMKDGAQSTGFNPKYTILWEELLYG